VGLALSLIDHEDYHHFKIIEKKNKIRLDREQVEDFEVDAEAVAELIAALKPVAPPAGTGKKKKKKKAAQKQDVWLKNN
jgi:hypothetical protein